MAITEKALTKEALEQIPPEQRAALQTAALEAMNKQQAQVAERPIEPQRPPVWTLSGSVLSRTNCRRLIQDIEARDQWETPTTFSNDKEHRVAQVFWLKEEDSPGTFRDLRDYSRNVSLLMGIDTDNVIDSIQMSKYADGENSYYRSHQDTDLTRQAIDVERKLSMVIALTHGGHYFELGGLQAFYLQEGDGLAFPSVWMHQAPVQPGTRYSLAIWVNGPAWR